MRAESALVVTSPLTAKEADMRGRMVRVIEQGERAFHDIGSALAVLFDEKLYRPKTWRAFLLEQFDRSDDWAAQLIGAAAVYRELKSGNCRILPANEAQCRPLAPLVTAQRREAWQEACDTMPKGRKTPPVAHVEAVVAKVTGVPVGVEADGTISQDLAEILAKLSPEEQEVIIHACEERAQKQRRDDGGDEPAWLSDWKFARSQLKWWEKKGDPPAPVIKALELLNEVRGLLEQAEELRKKRAA